jgi:hypothetical protein
MNSRKQEAQCRWLLLPVFDATLKSPALCRVAPFGAMQAVWHGNPGWPVRAYLLNKLLMLELTLKSTFVLT